MVATASSIPSDFYSVIPGGIHSKKQLAEVLATDPAVARHYADFDVQKLRFFRLRRGYDAYVSYRVGNLIFWTSKKIALFAGETLVSDGIHLARARCGNRISEVPRQPTSPWQPSLLELSLPILHPAPVLPNFPPLIALSVQPLPGSPGVETSGNVPYIPLFFLPPGGGPGAAPIWPQGPDAPLPTPEPPTLLLLSSGMTILGLKYLWNLMQR
ncbi:MAG TPA: hypothetical protein VNJ12_13330 [Candidatus Dormibacteraeota bacterium]|nr:hypothetical protein [Candidatus Dormibacteraeota bacterium]